MSVCGTPNVSAILSFFYPSLIIISFYVFFIILCLSLTHSIIAFLFWDYYVPCIIGFVSKWRKNLFGRSTFLSPTFFVETKLSFEITISYEKKKNQIFFQRRVGSLFLFFLLYLFPTTLFFVQVFLTPRSKILFVVKKPCFIAIPKGPFRLV